MASTAKVKAVFFDFMGTCLDWHSSVVGSFPSSVPKEEASKLALEWRRQYFIANSQRVQHGLPPENIDITLASTFKIVMQGSPAHASHFDDGVVSAMIRAWHSQSAWPEVQDAIRRVKEELGLDVFVHANGTTRLQLDLTRASGLNFSMLFSSQLLGVYKPTLEAYTRALELVDLKPEEVVLVAAHAYDLRGAQKAGMRTIYIHRWTDDIDEDMAQVKKEFDVFLEGMEGLPGAIESL